MHVGTEKADCWFSGQLAALLGNDAVPGAGAVRDVVAEGDKPQAAERDTETQPDNPGDAYAEVWRGYCEVIKQRAELLQGLYDREAKLVRPFTNTKRITVVSSEGEDDLANLRWECAKRIRRTLIGLAVERFSPGTDCQFEIDSEVLDDRYPLKRTTLDAFDPKGVWRYLEDTYGGSVGEQRAWQRVADAVRSELFSGWRNAADRVVEKGGYVVLEYSVWCSRTSNGRKTLTFETTKSLTHLFETLAKVARWSGRDALSEALAGAPRTMTLGELGALESRRRYAFGDGDQVVVVTYQSRFEFRLRKDVADQVQLFLGTYPAQE